MAPIGYSTGTLAKGNFRLGIRTLQGQPYAAIELSALREEELSPLVDALHELPLDQFAYVSIHAPSALVRLTDQDIERFLRPVFENGWPVVIHPDIISNDAIWREHGNLVCIENMDKRKPIGRTADELTQIFHRLPTASLCFDIAHARQVDPTMIEAMKILREHGPRIRQLHVSDVNAASQHEPLNAAAEMAYRGIARLIPPNIPIIMETPVDLDNLRAESDRALRVLNRV